jgi:hypothetical protein
MVATQKTGLTATVNGIDPLTQPLETIEIADISALVQRTQEMLETLELAHGTRFPWGSKGNILFEKHLEGRAFVFVSRPILVEVEDAFNKGQTKTIARVMVRRFDPESGELLAEQEARLQGGYVMSQLRAMTDNEMVGSYLWTLARDTDDSPYQRGDGWEYPRKLAIFDVSSDTPADASLDKSWVDSVQETAMKVAALADQGTTILPTRTGRK